MTASNAVKLSTKRKTVMTFSHVKMINSLDDYIWVIQTCVRQPLIVLEMLLR